MRSQGGFAGEVDQDAAAAGEDEAAAAEAVHEEAVEEIAEYCDEVEEAEQEERRVPVIPRLEKSWALQLFMTSAPVHWLPNCTKKPSPSRLRKLFWLKASLAWPSIPTAL